MTIPAAEIRACPACGAPHTVHQHVVSLVNRGSLLCPRCGKVLLSWERAIFYTLAVRSQPAKPDSED
ncbi:MAG: hypothetical protein SH850_14300 [Planctomycetaceae bacterium]|nr:hypothetical protein [Planctomycetaceae bacterium]